MRLRTRILLSLVMSLGLLAACGSEVTPADTTAVTQTTAAGSQIANPASEFCVAQGGTLEIVDEAAGQVGYCNLPDGTRVEEWEYFNSQSSSTTAP